MPSSGMPQKVQVFGGKRDLAGPADPAREAVWGQDGVLLTGRDSRMRQ